jgi:hypothetical protein
MNDDRIDLDALRPDRDPAAFERSIRAILDAPGLLSPAAPAVSEHAQTLSAGIHLVSGWRWPLLAAASIVAAVAVPTMLLVARPAADDSGDESVTVAAAIDIPAPLEAWMGAADPPPIADLLTAFREHIR